MAYRHARLVFHGTRIAGSVITHDEAELIGRHLEWQDANAVFTLRDEANALTAFAFRNGFLEDLHSGKPSPILSQPGYSRISNEGMRKLMIEASEKLEQMLRMKREDPSRYELFIRDYQKRYCRGWKRD